MTYVVSNIHGQYDLWQELLNKINFGRNDVMFVLGDIIDIGGQSMELLADLSFAENIWPIAGEHDRRAAHMLTGFQDMLESGAAPDPEYIAQMREWMANGGKETLDAFRNLSADMKEGILDYLNEMPLYDEVEVAGKSYLLMHSGITGYYENSNFDEYDESDYFGDSPRRKFSGYTVIVGHEPTTEAFDGSGCIYYGDGFIAVDCGAARGGHLGCLRLDDGREFYV